MASARPISIRLPSKLITRPRASATAADTKHDQRTEFTPELESLAHCNTMGSDSLPFCHQLGGTTVIYFARRRMVKCCGDAFVDRLLVEFGQIINMLRQTDGFHEYLDWKSDYRNNNRDSNARRCSRRFLTQLEKEGYWLLTETLARLPALLIVRV